MKKNRLKLVCPSCRTAYYIEEDILIFHNGQCMVGCKKCNEEKSEYIKLLPTIRKKEEVESGS